MRIFLDKSGHQEWAALVALEQRETDWVVKHWEDFDHQAVWLQRLAEFLLESNANAWVGYKRVYPLLIKTLLAAAPGKSLPLAVKLLVQFKRESYSQAMPQEWLALRDLLSQELDSQPYLKKRLGIADDC